MTKSLTLEILVETLAVCRLDAKAALPPWAITGHFFSVTRTYEELSVVCEAGQVPEGIQTEKNWRAFRVSGSVDFDLVGILAALVNPVAEADLGLFAISTFDTDYLLVKAKNFERAVEVLSAAGHVIKA
jgi:hypothetical protein